MARVLQTTISGVDANGYAWQNVLHFETVDESTPVNEQLVALNASITDNIIPAYKAASNEENQFFDVGSREITPTTSYTIHQPLAEVGDRAEVSNTGAVAGRIAFYPITGAYVGHIFITGVCSPDFVNDNISEDYLALLEDIRTALMLYTGETALGDFRLGIFNKKLSTIVYVVASAVLGRIGVLSKRVRA